MRLDLPVFIMTSICVIISGCSAGTTKEELTASVEARIDIAIQETAETDTTDTPTPLPKDTSLPTYTPTSISTDTPLPTDTPTPTDTPMPTDTPSPTPTNTRTNTPFSTDTSTPTPKPPIPNLPPPIPVSTAPKFDTTIIEPFTSDSFLRNLHRVRETFEELDALFVMISFGNSGNCPQFQALWNNWTEYMPFYTGVPSELSNLHTEYRVIMHQMVSTTAEIDRVCAGGGGTVSDETDLAIRDLLSWSIPRYNQMLSEAVQILG